VSVENRGPFAVLCYWLLFWSSLVGSNVASCNSRFHSVFRRGHWSCPLRRKPSRWRDASGRSDHFLHALSAALHFEWSNLAHLTPASHSWTNIGLGLVMSVK
jgi:hypothetical protein